VTFATGGEVFVADVVGRELTNLTESDIVDRAPAWSPNGRLIAWLGGENVHVMHQDGAHQTRVTYVPRPPIGAPVWSPAPRRARLAFTVGNGHNDDSGIYVTSDGYSRPRNATQTARRSEFAPAWSPDGESLVFTRGTLWLMRAGWDAAAAAADTIFRRPGHMGRATPRIATSSRCDPEHDAAGDCTDPERTRSTRPSHSQSRSNVPNR
jgi:Tol biopolymer transport system component